MKIITIKQPWAWAIFHAGKDVENRKWLHRYRGPLGIHAAKSTAPRDYKIAADFIRRLGYEPPTFADLRERGETGAILGTVDFTGTKTDSDWYLGKEWDKNLTRRIKAQIAHEYHGCYGWHFENPVTLAKPIAVTGRLGLWNFDLESEQ